jgi:monovalent cation:H+ antiporter-2, CPA2 family
LVLEKAYLNKAKALAIALPDPASTQLLLKRALELAPDLDIVARSHQNEEIDLLTLLWQFKREMKPYIIQMLRQI